MYLYAWFCICRKRSTCEGENIAFLENKICDDKKLTSCEKKYKITKNLSDKYELQILSDGMTEKEEHENGTYHKRRSL